MIDELVWMYYAYKIGNACVGLAFLSFVVIMMYLIASVQFDKFSRTAFIVLLSVFASLVFVSASSPSLGEIKAYITYRIHIDVPDQKEADRLIERITKCIEDGNTIQKTR